MGRFGNDEEGFEVTVDETTATVRVRAWGFWGPEVASQFATKVLEACAPPRRVSQLIVDALGLKPQREAGQEAFGRVIAALPSLGVARASVTTDSPLTKLQLLRIARERMETQSVEFNWILTR